MSSGSFGFAWVHSDESRCRLVHSGSLRFTRMQLGVVGFIWARVGLLVSTEARRVHSSWSGLKRALLKVAGLIRVCGDSLRRS